MAAQAAVQMERPAVATLTGYPPAVACVRCGGKGELGHSRKLVVIDGHVLFTTHTQWCPVCKGVGLVWKETTA